MSLKIINEYLENYVGVTKKQKVIDDCFRYLLEEKRKCMPRLSFASVGLVHITDPNEKMPAIESIGGSTPEDLFTDNFGEMLGAWFMIVKTGSQTGTHNMKGIDATILNYRAFTAMQNNSPDMYNAGGFPGSAVASGMLMQVGQVGAVNRDDFNINSAFPSSPESDLKSVTGSGASFDEPNGRTSWVAQITPTTDAGTIAELASYHRGTDTTNQSDINQITRMITHDSISPNVSFLSGKSINMEVIIQI